MTAIGIFLSTTTIWRSVILRVFCRSITTVSKSCIVHQVVLTSIIPKETIPADPVPPSRNCGQSESFASSEQKVRKLRLNNLRLPFAVNVSRTCTLLVVSQCKTTMPDFPLTIHCRDFQSRLSPFLRSSCSDLEFKDVSIECCVTICQRQTLHTYAGCQKSF